MREKKQQTWRGRGRRRKSKESRVSERRENPKKKFFFSFLNEEEERKKGHSRTSTGDEKGVDLILMAVVAATLSVRSIRLS